MWFLLFLLVYQLQDAVSGMKSAFVKAHKELESYQNEEESVRSSVKKCQQQSSDILRLMISLKLEVSSLKEMMNTTQAVQHELQSNVQSLLIERDYLLDELAKNGAVTDNFR